MTTPPAEVIAPEYEVDGPRDDPGLSPAFLRCLGATTLTILSVALFRWEGPSLSSPGPLPLLLLAAALLIVGPASRSVRPSRLCTAGLIALTAGFAVCLSGMFGWPEEKSAALVTVPVWCFLAAIVATGWILRQAGAGFVLAALSGMAVLRLVLGATTGWTSESVWWLATLVWLLGVFVGKRVLQREASGSPLLIGGVLWFVLLVAALTIQEMRHPLAPYGTRDDAAAAAAIRVRPLAGYGAGSFERVMPEFALRPPPEASSAHETAPDATPASPGFVSPWATRAILRLIVEHGLTVVLLFSLGLVLPLAGTFARRTWTGERVACLGVAGLWCVALIAMRDLHSIPMAVLGFALPSSLGREEFPEGAEKRRAFESWGIAVALLILPAILFPYAEWQWRRQKPETNIDARAVLPQWEEPHRERALAIRYRSLEIAQYADPRDYLKPVVKDWLAVSPRDERALMEAVRLAEKSGGSEAAERVALEAHEILPWSPLFPAWVARMRVEQGRAREAVEFLSRLAEERRPLHPALYKRLETLRQTLGEEEPDDGN